MARCSHCGHKLDTRAFFFVLKSRGQYMDLYVTNEANGGWTEKLRFAARFVSPPVPRSPAQRVVKVYYGKPLT